MSISAMKYALQALENPWGTGAEGVANAIIFLRQAIAEAEKQEPVAQCSYPKCQATNGCVGDCSKGQTDLARVGEVGVWGDKREWVEITKGECDELFRAASDHVEYAFAIDAKLKEKNK